VEFNENIGSPDQQSLLDIYFWSFISFHIKTEGLNIYFFFSKRLFGGFVFILHILVYLYLIT